ncbi:MAG: hypothetical protein QMD71_06770 [bacterium]|nr:hypothetical protein [bacterium]
MYGAFMSDTDLIDSPTAYISSTYFEMGMTSSLTTKNDSHPFNIDMHIKFHPLKQLEVGLSILGLNLLSGEFKCKVCDETPFMPVISFGSLGISTQHWLSSVGAGEDIGYADDLSYKERDWEQFSAFIVATKNFGPFGVYNIGIGRGSFVGYGPRSRLFNSDYFFKTNPPPTLGIFWGGEIELTPPVFAVSEFTGRDFNVGIKIKTDFFQIGIGAIKLEHRLGGAPILYPRFAIGGSINSLVRRKLVPKVPKIGALTGTVIDAHTKEPLFAVVSFPRTAISPVSTNVRTGRYIISLKPGSYWVRAEAAGYYWVEKKIYIAKEMTTTCNFELTKKE